MLFETCGYQVSVQERFTCLSCFTSLIGPELTEEEVAVLVEQDSAFNGLGIRIKFRAQYYRVFKNARDGSFSSLGHGAIL
jgi:hypothetical protein